MEGLWFTQTSFVESSLGIIPNVGEWECHVRVGKWKDQMSVKVCFEPCIGSCPPMMTRRSPKIALEWAILAGGFDSPSCTFN
mmetsp:Transcript_4682/g.6536  ORF Transcript_4682/g.6536 Transcript_4682/m.6536 type:complete len:82 (-) Transcript_4682:1188-1433(-)